MSNVIDQLHADHINIAKVIDLLKKQYEQMNGDGSPDFSLMLDILDYIHSYPDYIHHPRENVVFKVYLEQHDELQETIAELMKEHKEMAERTRDLYEEIDGILNDSMVDKQELKNKIATFIQQQMQHMDTEEGAVFPTLRTVLTPEEFDRIETELPSREDPLFGDVVQKRFEALYEHITHMPA